MVDRPRMSPPPLWALLQGVRAGRVSNPEAGWLGVRYSAKLAWLISPFEARQEPAMPHPLPPLSACLTTPNPLQAQPHTRPSPPVGGGPGWFESSWDLFCGLDVAELEADGRIARPHTAQPAASRG